MPGGQTISDYTEPLTNAGLAGGAAFGASYFLSTDQQRGAFTPLIVASAAAGAALVSQALISPGITNTFNLNNKNVSPPSINTTDNTPTNPYYNTANTTPPPPPPLPGPMRQTTERSGDCTTNFLPPTSLLPTYPEWHRRHRHDKRRPSNRRGHSPRHSRRHGPEHGQGHEAHDSHGLQGGHGEHGQRKRRSNKHKHRRRKKKDMDSSVESAYNTCKDKYGKIIYR